MGNGLRINSLTEANLGTPHLQGVDVVASSPQQQDNDQSYRTPIYMRQYPSFTIQLAMVAFEPLVEMTEGLGSPLRAP